MDHFSTFVWILLPIAIMSVGFLYASVGHAGASGYIAVMTLFQVAPETIKPVALVLNIGVAVVGAAQFWKAGHFSWRLFWPFALLSVPMAFIGGKYPLPGHWLKPLLGAVLLLSAARLVLKLGEIRDTKPPHPALASGIGGGIGLLSGWTGTGGGIFLTPVLLLCRWAPTKQAAAVSAAFILVNSISGLGGHLCDGKPIPALAWLLFLPAVLGGFAGAWLGSRKWPVRTIQVMLAVVLVMAGTKLLWV